MFIAIEEIDRLIKEDVPYIDLTSWSLGIGDQLGRIAYFTRDEAVACGTEEVKMIFERLSIKTEQLIPSGTAAKPGDELICGTGRACDINIAWKVGQNILDHCSGIATKTRKMVQIVKEANPNVAVLTTRKGFPGTKSLAIKSIMVGGATPHRLGLSETVLIFKQHIDYIGGFEALLAKIPELRIECCEKKVLVESTEYEQARLLCEAGVDGIQFDKLSAEALKEAVAKLRAEFPKVIFLAAGGVNEKNAAEYAKTNVDGIVTTSLYSAEPIDVGVKIKPL
ncbi:MAG: ModD protein [Oscillospiraceae bacterium]|nr:ModD protein [Oscillospiraceae bacterium]